MNEYPKWVKRAPDIGPVMCLTEDEEIKLMMDWMTEQEAKQFGKVVETGMPFLTVADIEEEKNFVIEEEFDRANGAPITSKRVDLRQGKGRK